MIIKEICNIKKKLGPKNLFSILFRTEALGILHFPRYKNVSLPHNKIIVYYSNYYIGVFWVFFITRKINNERCMFF